MNYLLISSGITNTILSLASLSYLSPKCATINLRIELPYSAKSISVASILKLTPGTSNPANNLS